MYSRPRDGAPRAPVSTWVPTLERDSSNHRPVRPVLAFPEPGVDDTASYQGYQTRVYRDSKDNTVQIYLQPQTSRGVLVWADAANRERRFHGPRCRWAAHPGDVGRRRCRGSDSGAARSIEYPLRTDVSRIELGWFLLGSMRVERDFVYARRHLDPFTAPPFRVAEESLLVAAV